jgi:hypothetical protein
MPSTATPNPARVIKLRLLPIVPSLLNSHQSYGQRKFVDQ